MSGVCHRTQLLSVFFHQVSSAFLLFPLSFTYSDALTRSIASFACARSWKIIDGTRAATGAVEASSFSYCFKKINTLFFCSRKKKLETSKNLKKRGWLLRYASANGASMFSWLPIFICFAIVYAQKLPEIRAALFGEA